MFHHENSPLLSMGILCVTMHISAGENLRKGTNIKEFHDENSPLHGHSLCDHGYVQPTEVLISPNMWGRYILYLCNCRPQTKLREGNVFISVCLSSGGGGWVHPEGMHSQDGCTPTHLLRMDAPTHPPRQKTNGQQVGGMHPTGMHTYFFLSNMHFYVIISKYDIKPAGE